MRHLILPFLALGLLLSNLPLVLELSWHKIAQKMSLVWVLFVVVLYLGMVYKKVYKSVFFDFGLTTTSPSPNSKQVTALESMLQQQPTYTPALLLLHQLKPESTPYLDQATQLNPRLLKQDYRQNHTAGWVVNPN